MVSDNICANRGWHRVDVARLRRCLNSERENSPRTIPINLVHLLLHHLNFSLPPKSFMKPLAGSAVFFTVQAGFSSRIAGFGNFQ